MGVVVLYTIDVILAIMIIFLEKKNPQATLAWIMVLFLLPVVGIVFYFLFSQNIAKRKMFRLSDSEEKLMDQMLERQKQEMKSDDFFINDAERDWQSMIAMNQKYAHADLSQNNIVDFFTDGNHKLDAMLSDIANATNYINIQYFILKNDITGQSLINALTVKAKEGVRVRLLLDAMGSKQINNKLLLDYLDAGGKVGYFFPPFFRSLNIRFNYRNHRKLVVIDGEVGYIGGFNIANEYIGLKKKFGYWRDTHIRIRGDALIYLNERFIRDWRNATKERLDIGLMFNVNRNVNGTTPMQIVSSGPDSYKEEVKHGYLKMISGAKRRICIQTPYFVPDSSIFDSLLTAANSGVDVKIMIPCMPDHIFVYWATYYYCGLLLGAGVKVYIYNNGFLHAKTMTVDDEVCSVGSANFDIRSFRLNFECNAFMYDVSTARRMRDIFEEDMSYCKELTRLEYKNRSRWIRFKERLAKLLSDIL
jgi:cardiolipin synthase